MIKRFLVAALWLPLLALAQSYPSPTFNNLTVNGTLNAATVGLTSPLPVASGGTGSGTASGTALDNISGFSGSGYIKRTGSGAYAFVLPIPVSDGGTGAASASGTALDNITGFNSTGFMSRAGAGSYSFSSRINLTNLANQAANTVVANATASSTTPTAFAMPSCSTSSSAVNYTTNTGFGCNSSINAATLGGATFAAPGPIGSTTASTGAFTTISASSTITPSTTAGIVGTATNDSANAGSFGEYPTPVALTGTALTSGTSANIASMSLTAGDWDVVGTITFVPAGSTVITYVAGGLSSTSATLPAGNTGASFQYAGSSTAGINIIPHTPTVRFSLSATTTVYLVANSIFATSTMTANGFIRARRVR